MNNADWLRPSVDSVPLPAAETGASLTRGQRVAVALGIGAVAACTAAALYRSNCRGPPQVLLRRGHSVSLSSPEADGVRALTLVNFPPDLRVVFERALRVLVGEAELPLRDAPVMLFHDVVDPDPASVAGLAQREALSAFEQIGTPCAVYRAALAVNGETVSPFLSPRAAVKMARGRVVEERYCIAYTVDGRRADVLTHDTCGTIVTDVERAFRAGTFHAGKNADRNDDPDDAEAALRRCFVATDQTFARNSRKERADYSAPIEPIGVAPATALLRALWIGPAPLFAMFGVAARYGCAALDGWRLLAERDGSGVDALLRMLTFSANTDAQQRRCEAFCIELELHSGDADSLAETLCNSNGDRSSGRMQARVIAGSAPAARCVLPAGLTVFSAMTELWRVAACAAAHGHKVRIMRLAVAVVHSAADEPLVPLWPCAELDIDAHACTGEGVDAETASFFAPAQYFVHVPAPGAAAVRVETAEAFRRITEGQTEGLHYIIAEYATDDLQ